MELLTSGKQAKDLICLRQVARRFSEGVQFSKKKKKNTNADKDFFRISLVKLKNKSFNVIKKELHVYGTFEEFYSDFQLSLFLSNAGIADFRNTFLRLHLNYLITR